MENSLAILMRISGDLLKYDLIYLKSNAYITNKKEIELLGEISRQLVDIYNLYVEE